MPTLAKHPHPIAESSSGLYIVRLYDGFDNSWTDVSKPVVLREAERVWRTETENGLRKTTYSDIDYYRIFPADTKMVFASKIRRG